MRKDIWFFFCLFVCSLAAANQIFMRLWSDAKKYSTRFTFVCACVFHSYSIIFFIRFSSDSHWLAFCASRCRHVCSPCVQNTYITRTWLYNRSSNIVNYQNIYTTIKFGRYRRPCIELFFSLFRVTISCIFVLFDSKHSRNLRYYHRLQHLRSTLFEWYIQRCFGFLFYFLIWCTRIFIVSALNQTQNVWTILFIINEHTSWFGKQTRVKKIYIYTLVHTHANAYEFGPKEGDFDWVRARARAHVCLHLLVLSFSLSRTWLHTGLVLPSSRSSVHMR